MKSKNTSFTFKKQIQEFASLIGQFFSVRNKQLKKWHQSQGADFGVVAAIAFLQPKH